MRGTEALPGTTLDHQRTGVEACYPISISHFVAVSLDMDRISAKIASLRFFRLASIYKLAIIYMTAFARARGLISSSFEK